MTKTSGGSGTKAKGSERCFGMFHSNTKEIITPISEKVSKRRGRGKEEEGQQKESARVFQEL